MDAVRDELVRVPRGFGPAGSGEEGAGTDPGPRRVLVHTSGFRMSPYADVAPAGSSTGVVTGAVARKLWHRSPGSAG